MPPFQSFFKYVRHLSVLVSLLAVVTVIGDCAMISPAGSAGGATTSPTVTTSGATMGSSTGTTTSTGAPPTPASAPPPSVHQVFQAKTLASAQIGPVTATCPSGELALSGGWATSPSLGAYPVVFKSSRNGSAGWSIFVQYTGTTVVTAYALCLKNAAGATVTERAETGLVHAQSSGWQSASCNRGENVVGGGFSGYTGMKLSDSHGSDDFINWAVYPTNGSLASQPFTVFAECLRYSGVSSSHSIGVQSSGHAISGECPGGGFLSGGGFMAAAYQPVAYIMRPTASGQKWEVFEVSGAGLTAQAICLTL